MNADPLGSAVAACAAALQQPSAEAIRSALGTRSADPAHLYAMVERVTEDAGSQAALRALKSVVNGAASDAAAFELFVLRTAAVTRPPTAIAVCEGVSRLIAETVDMIARPSPDATRAELGSSRFVVLCKILTNRRFPAGQFDWEISGIPRSALLRVPRARLPGVAAFTAFRMGGLAPVMFSHLSPFRRNKSLDEYEANRSYARMARSLERQPGVKGFAAWSWFRSPGTHAVSPHLAWLSRVFLEHGGLVTECGPDDPTHGALHRSATRRRLFERGEYVPTKGLVMWPRRAMIDWARSHPELDD
jgi:hypothetical protein